MHPSDDTDTAFFVVGSLEHGFHFLGRVGRTFIYHLDRQLARLVQTFYHLVTVCINCDDCVSSVQKLCSCDEPYFILIKCVHNSTMFINYWVMILLG